MSKFTETEIHDGEKKRQIGKSESITDFSSRKLLFSHAICFFRGSLICFFLVALLDFDTNSGNNFLCCKNKDS